MPAVATKCHGALPHWALGSVPSTKSSVAQWAKCSAPWGLVRRTSLIALRAMSEVAKQTTKRQQLASLDELGNMKSGSFAAQYKALRAKNFSLALNEQIRFAH